MEYSLYGFLDSVLEKVCYCIPGKPTFSSYPLHEAVEKENITAVFIALMKIPVDSPGRYGETALIQASSKPFTCKNRRIIKILLRKGADPMKRYRDRSAAYYIFKRKEMDLIKAVLQYISDVNQPVFHNDKLLDTALKSYDFAAAQILLDMGAKFEDCEENTYLHETLLFSEDSSLVGKLLKAGLDVNSRDCLDHTPLHYAALGSSIDCLEEILKAKPEANPIEKGGNTPINYVIKHSERCSEGTFDLMLKYGCDLNIHDRNGCTPLHNLFNASGLNSARNAKLLLEGGADTNLKNHSGRTPLHLSLEHGYHSCSKLLIKGGADINIRDSSGKTALHLAHHYDILLVDFMIRHLAMLKHLRNREIGKDVMEMIESNVNLSIYLQQCEAEILNLKFRMGDSNLSYAQCFWLSRKIVGYARNDEVKYAIHKFNSYEFPLYGRKIRINSVKALVRRYLEDVAEQWLTALIFGEVLPHNCVTNIVKFFTEEELMFLRFEIVLRYNRKQFARAVMLYIYMLYVFISIIGISKFMI